MPRYKEKPGVILPLIIGLVLALVILGVLAYTKLNQKPIVFAPSIQNQIQSKTATSSASKSAAVGNGQEKSGLENINGKLIYRNFVYDFQMDFSSFPKVQISGIDGKGGTQFNLYQEDLTLKTPPKQSITNLYVYVPQKNSNLKSLDDYKKNHKAGSIQIWTQTQIVSSITDFITNSRSKGIKWTQQPQNINESGVRYAYYVIDLNGKFIYFEMSCTDYENSTMSCNSKFIQTQILLEPVINSLTAIQN